MRKLLWCFLLFVSAAAFSQSRIKVACIGDSITEGLDIDSTMRYPAQLQRILGDAYEVRNFGVSGRTLLKRGDYPFWQEQKYRDALAWAPDVVVIKLGTNDSKPQNWIYGEDFVSNYRELVQSFKKLPGKRKLYLCTPVPVFKEAFSISESVVHEEVLPMVQQVAKSENLKVVDIFTAFKNKGDLVPDGIHPNAEGATIMATEVAKAIRSK